MSRGKSVQVLLNGIVYVGARAGTGTSMGAIDTADAVAEVVVVAGAAAVAVAVAVTVTVTEKIVGIEYGLVLVLVLLLPLLLLQPHACCASPNQVCSKRVECWGVLKNLVKGGNT